MITEIITALGLVLIVEGLVYALAPSLVERLLEAMKHIPLSTRRNLGLLTMVTGLLMVWIIRG